MSAYFNSKKGVRQGENLSPILFALFMNDLKDCLVGQIPVLSTVVGEALKLNLSDADIDTLLNLFLLLYADDTVIFSETAKGLQTGLSLVNLYCDKNKLQLNISRCKVMIFSRGKVRIIPEFFYWR